MDCYTYCVSQNRREGRLVLWKIYATSERERELGYLSRSRRTGGKKKRDFKMG